MAHKKKAQAHLNTQQLGNLKMKKSSRIFCVVLP